MASPAQVTIQLRSDDVDESRLQNITRDMAHSLEEERIGTVKLGEDVPRPGTKGDPLLIGNIVLAVFATHGVVNSLVGVLRAYAERSRSLQLEFSRPDGKRIKLNGDNLSQKQLAETARLLQTFLRG